jgi:hypothetical protein
VNTRRDGRGTGSAAGGRGSGGSLDEVDTYTRISDEPQYSHEVSHTVLAKRARATHDPVGTSIVDMLGDDPEVLALSTKSRVISSLRQRPGFIVAYGYATVSKHALMRLSRHSVTPFR